jgi:omega-6 fatty acid desaturase (delta-12 desaturase)
LNRIKQQKRTMIGSHAKSDDGRALLQILTTLAPLALLWWATASLAGVSRWLVIALVPLIALFTLRVFALMHDCGHDSLFRSPQLNRAFGFVLGVIAGMPQYVWSKHHNFHHAHNGNWEKYRGPYTTLSVDEYEAMSGSQRRLYRGKCSMGTAPLAGFIYLIFNPRFTWLRGSIGLLLSVLKGKVVHPGLSIRAQVSAYRTRYWKSAAEYRHMCWNNIALLSAWALMCWAIGAPLFFAVYLVSVSLAGGAGIVLFTVQHNFKHAYAADTEHWDYDTGAIHGTSYLVLPGWLNWFTADIGYHHVHHLSAHIPNYCLGHCHREYEHLFGDVVRLQLSEVRGALRYILWDRRAGRLISVAEYQQQLAAPTV